MPSIVLPREMQVTGQRTLDLLTHIMTDDYSRRILLSAVAAPKTVEELSKENNIPLSTCYRRVHEMLEGGALVVERIVVTHVGKKYELYRSSFKGLSIKLDGGTITMEATINESISDKLHNTWTAMKWNNPDV